MNSPHKGPVTQKMFPFDDVIMRDFVRGVKNGTEIPPMQESISGLSGDIFTYIVYQRLAMRKFSHHVIFCGLY